MRIEMRGTKTDEFGLVELIRFVTKCLPAVLIFVAAAGIFTYLRYRRDPSYTADGVMIVESSKNNRVQAVTDKIAGAAGLGANDTEQMIDKFFLLFYSRDFNIEVAQYIKDKGLFDEVAATLAPKGGEIKTVEELGERIFALVVVEKATSETFRMNISVTSPEKAVKGLNYMMDSFSQILLERESKDLLDAKKVLEGETAESEQRLKAIDDEIIRVSSESSHKKGLDPKSGNAAEDSLEQSILQLRAQLTEVRSMIADSTAHATRSGDLPTDKYSSGASLAALSRQEHLLELRLATDQKLLVELRSAPDDRIRYQRIIEDLYKRKEFEYRIYSDLKKETLNIDIQHATAKNKMKVLDRPTLASVRTGETLRPLLVKRCFMAAVFALILVFFRELFNPLIRNRRELDALGLQYMGSVPNMSRRRRFNLTRWVHDLRSWFNHLGDHHKRPDTPLNTYFEMIFKNIAARVLNYHDESKPAPKVIALMSSVSAEGKTTIAESLARVLAKSGKRTLLVDCDLRRRTLSRRMGFATEHGLADFLQNSNEKFETRVVKTVDKNFEFMPSGMSSVDAMELISGANYSDFIEAMRHYYEVIVIDTPRAFRARK